MKNRRNHYVISLLALPLAWSSCYADTTATITLASDYLLYGVTQTQSKPAAQFNLDWGDESGIYSGLFTSTVDYFDEDKTTVEIDFYAGYFFTINDDVSIDVGLGHYTFHGHDDEAYKSSDFNYTDMYLSLIIFQSSQLNLTYAPNFLGSDTYGYSVELSHQIELGENEIMFSVGRTVSGDIEKWEFFGDDNYQYGAIHIKRSFSDFDWLLGIETTDVDRQNDPDRGADTVLLLSVSKEFSW